MPSESGFTINTITGLGLYGVLYTGFNTGTGAGTLVGVSRGGLTFNPNTELRNPEYDGKHANIRGLDRFIFRNPQITGTILQVTNANLLELFEPGGATPATLKDSGTFLAVADYLVNVAVAFKRSNNTGYFGYNFPSAVVTQYEIAGQGSDGEVEAAITVEARLVQGATPDELTAPFETFEV